MPARDYGDVLQNVASGGRLPDALDSWAARRTNDVLELAYRRAIDLTQSPNQRLVMQTAFRLQEAQLRRAVWPELVFLPLLVFAAIEGDEAPAIPLAAAC